MAAGGAPERLVQEVEALRQAALQRYGTSLVRLSLGQGAVRGMVALPAQEAQLRELVQRHWPGAAVSLLVLSQRRARLALEPAAAALDIWRRPPEAEGEPERTTQLLPGDPPALVVLMRPQSLLVRAPGGALGWAVRGEVPLRAARCVGPSQPAPGWAPERVLRSALSLEGLPYRWGATGFGGADCSGLVWRAFYSEGVVLPRNSRAQRQVGERIRLEAMEAGDLLCAISRGERRTSHVALALSASEVVHACSELERVLREPLSEFLERYRVLTIRRLEGRRGSDG